MNRLVIITGGTSGIGAQLKKLFEKKGDKVITFSIDESNDINHYQGSVDHEIKVKQVFNDIYQNHGKIDILINNAGIGMSGITELIPTEQIQKVTQVNYYGTLFCTRSALPYMECGSKIINMSSAMALFPVPFRSIYGSVKSAVLNLSLSLRMELAPLGIDVVAFCPGDTKTNFTKNRIKEFETNERYGDRIKNATERSDAKEDKRMSCEYVSNKIFKLINKQRTKPFYIIGGKYKLLYFLTRFTPKATLLKATAKIYDKPMKVKVKPIQETTKANTPVVNEQKEEIINETKEPVVDTPKDNIQTPTENTETKSDEVKNNNINQLLSKIQILNKSNDNKED